jgi:chitinase
VVCYYTNWAQYVKDEGKFVAEDIDPNLCTHIIFSFAKLNAAYELEPLEWNDGPLEWSKGMYERTLDLKLQNPNLKIMIAVGGWNAGSGPFSNMVTDTALRQKFISTSLAFLKKHKFDGLDLE